MNDELDRLRSALHAATPSADERARAQTLKLARQNFDRTQESAATSRPMRNRSGFLAGIATGVRTMLASIGTRSALYAASSAAVIGLGVFIVLPDNRLTPRSSPTVLNEAEHALAPRRRSDADEAVHQPEAAPLPLMKNLDVSENFAEFSLRAPAAVVASSERLVVIAPVLGDENFPLPAGNTERFASAQRNRLKITAEEPVSTFSVDVDTASYAFVRAALNGGQLPPPDAVRIEEMINYFPYDYKAPVGGETPFSTSVRVMQTPWNPDTQLVHIGLQGVKASTVDRPPLNLVFLIDTSGSMHDSNKLPLLKQSFRLLLSRLSDGDKVAIVTYAGSAGVVLEPTSASERSLILAAMERLEAGGSTAGQAGLQQAYALAESMQGEGRVGRVLLATDGDFNVGISDPEALKAYVEDRRESGVYLSVLGFGRGNYNDALMQSLAQNGNGTASYIDTLSEAQKVLVDQVSGALFPIANDVKIQIEFNPAAIAQYRLIGYETRLLAREDFNNDKVDAGDIGAGHTVTALYEVTPVGSAAIKSDALRYQTSPAIPDGSGELGFVKLRYKHPGSDISQLQTTLIPDEADAVTTEVRFAAAIAGFGQLLSDDRYLVDWTYDDAIGLANQAKGEDEYGYRAEAVALMRLAQLLSR